EVVQSARLALARRAADGAQGLARARRLVAAEGLAGGGVRWRGGEPPVPARQRRKVDGAAKLASSAAFGLSALSGTVYVRGGRARRVGVARIGSARIRLAGRLRADRPRREPVTADAVDRG